MTGFLLLGPVEIHGADGACADPGPGRQRAVLAALVVDAGRWVSMSTLIDRVWGEDVPAQARPSLYAYISRIRRTLKDLVPSDGASTDTPPQLRRGPGGYMLDVPPADVDVLRFRQLVEHARVHNRTDAERVVMLRAALGLWRGEPLAGLAGAWAERTRASCVQERIEATREWAEAELRLGRPAEVIGTLTGQVAEYPLVEPLTVALMRALQLARRGPEALTLYTVLQKRLAQELGTDPGIEAQQAHQAILRDAPVLPTRPATAVVDVIDEPARHHTAPAQLPLRTAAFTGRHTELAVLDNLLAATMEPSSAAVVAVVWGTAGVGKTALAVHWAHAVADRFPDGQLYVNLRGFDPSGVAVTADRTLRGFLEAMGIPAEAIPVDFEARVGLYRSLLARRRVLVVLDNAADADQVRALLPGSAGCLALVTSRNRLTGLVATEGAHPIALDLLSPAEARELLARRIGEHRLTAEPHAVTEIITRCARLPLALAVTIARAAIRPTLSLTRLAADLSAARGSLAALAGDGDDPAADVRRVFSWSYDALGPGAARLFALLGLHLGPEISTPAAASLGGLGLDEVRDALAELSRAHLVTECFPDRYALHDLLRAYAAELARTLDADCEQRPALHRLLDHYVSTAHAADQVLEPYRPRIVPLATGPGTHGVRFTEGADALAWFAAELPVLLAVLRQAADTEMDTHAWQLARGLATYLQRRGTAQDFLTSQHIGLAAARRSSDVTGQAHAHVALAHAHTRLRRLEEAHAHFDLALELFGRTHDVVGQGDTRAAIAAARSLEGRYDTKDHLLQALEDFRTAGHQVGQARVLNNFGWYYATQRDPRALTRCAEALSLLEGTRDGMLQAAAWDTYGYAHHQLGHHDQALACYRRALELFREVGDRFGEVATLTHLGDTHHATDDPEAAARAWRGALDILEGFDQPGTDDLRARLSRIVEG
ncbi:BTAD domain-containing putative transcriptional regulator [Streptomyces sp. S.PB5]|uniref:AfsR/SARP family transcriptional regulator n=1 Tax=Streptomyces sp. S.PB5 TaxID=3020844 RepID=UPI0025B0B5C7|nr:BTAD domain-containing putative transcriptional regulator [Streptomyces sp. S.PB5]MDN3028355.1 BTAD domain-containing putative transcriptional regulator [Streptomyces sp. S.PB5]